MSGAEAEVPTASAGIAAAGTACDPLWCDDDTFSVAAAVVAEAEDVDGGAVGRDEKDGGSAGEVALLPEDGAEWEGSEGCVVAADGESCCCCTGCADDDEGWVALGCSKDEEAVADV